LWTVIDSLQLKVYGNIGITFPTTTTFQKPDSLLIKNIRAKASTYLSKPSVVALGLFNHGALTKSSFWQSLEPIASQLKNSSNLPLYYTSRLTNDTDATSFDFVLLEVPVNSSNIGSLSVPQSQDIRGYVYAPSKELKSYLTPLKKLIEQVPQKTIFLPSNWLFRILDDHPQFAKTLKSATGKNGFVFPLPKESLPSPTTPVLTVIFLLVVWGTIAFHYHISPLYRKSIFRYFIAHKFFINDIYNRYIRSPLAAIIILLQNALLISTSAYACFAANVTDLGKEAFFFHFPILALWKNSYFSLFLLIFLTIVVLSFAFITWLYLSHKKVRSFTQIASIYTWPLQINFVLSTISLTLFAAEYSFWLANVFTALSFIIFISSFFVSVYDLTKFSNNPLKYHVKTSVPYVLILAGLLMWVLLHQQWIEAISLALNLK